MTCRNLNKTFDELFETFPDNRSYVIEALHYSKIEEYCKFMEHFLSNEIIYNDPSTLCPMCETHTIINGECEACFCELSLKTCAGCDEQYYDTGIHSILEFCPWCGAKIQET
jgi:hypothetical protein